MEDKSGRSWGKCSSDTTAGNEGDFSAGVGFLLGGLGASAQGKMDDFRVYVRALLAAEIAGLAGISLTDGALGIGTRRSDV